MKTIFHSEWEDFMRRMYYGWWIVIALAITETVSWGILYYAFSVFLTSTEAEMGWTRAEVTGAFSLGFLLSGFMAIPVGFWLDKHGARLLMTLGSVCAALLVMAWAFVDNLTMFYVIWLGIGLCAAAVLYDPAFTVMANWFVRRRSLGLAIITFAAGLASTIFLPLADFLLHELGWRMAIFSLGLMLAVITIPLHALFLRRRPYDLGLLPDGEKLKHDDDSQAVFHIEGIPMRQAIRGASFWWLTLSFCLSLLASIAIRVHFIPYLSENGYDATTAAWLGGLIGFMQVIGRLVFAPMEMRLSAKGVTAVTMFILTASFGLLIISQNIFVVGLFVVVFGSSFGAMTLARPSMIAEYYGTREYGKINSVMTFASSFALTGAPFGASLLYEYFNGYQPILWIMMFASVLSMLALSRVRKPRKLEILDV